MIPVWGKLQALLTWKRQGSQPIWIVSELTALESPSYFDIVLGMRLYAVDSHLAAFAPPNVLQTVYGCLFAHTANFAFAPQHQLMKNGNLRVPALSSWPQALARAERWGFETAQLQHWLHDRPKAIKGD